MKKIFLILSLLLLTGCTARYNLNYTNDKYSESLDIIKLSENEMDGNTSLSENLNYYYNNVDLSTSYKNDSGDFEMNNNNYNKLLIDKGLNLNYNFTNKSEYANSNIAHSLFNNFYVSEDYIQGYVISNVFDNYKSLTNIEIIFSTDKIVKESNADKEKDNVYYWYINKDNYKDKVVDIKFSKVDNNSDILSKDGYLNISFFKYILMIIAIIFLISIVVIYEKVKKSNK